MDEARGIVRRQRVYRQLLMTMGMYREADTEEDFAYVRNQRNLLQGELSELLDCELHVHRTAAFLVLNEDCRMGRCFPEENTRSDVVLLLNDMLQEEIKKGAVEIGTEERIQVPREYFTGLLEKCREQYGAGFGKTFREMTTREFCDEILSYMTELGLIEEKRGDVRVSLASGKIAGRYPADFSERLAKEKEGETHEQ